MESQLESQFGLYLSAKGLEECIEECKEKDNCTVNAENIFQIAILVKMFKDVLNNLCFREI
jgi:hypothetical protein